MQFTIKTNHLISGYSILRSQIDEDFIFDYIPEILKLLLYAAEWVFYVTMISHPY